MTDLTLTPPLPLGPIPRPEPKLSAWDRGFAERLQRARKAHHRNTQLAAQATGLCARSWQNWEQGVAIPGADSLRLICEKLRVEPAWLLWGREPMELS